MSGKIPSHSEINALCKITGASPSLVRDLYIKSGDFKGVKLALESLAQRSGSVPIDAEILSAMNDIKVCGSEAKSCAKSIDLFGRRGGRAMATASLQ